MLDALQNKLIKLNQITFLRFYNTKKIINSELKKTHLVKFCFPYISSSGDHIFEKIVSTPHNNPIIMADRHKNFGDPINWSRDKRKIKFDL